MSKENLEHLGAIADALHNLWDAAEAQHRNAQDQQTAATDAIRQMQTATGSVQVAARSLKGELAKEVREALTDASTEAARLIAQKFTEANQLADEAATTYRSVVKWSAWRVFLISAVMFAFVVGAVVFVVTRSIPSYDEIERLRAEKALMEKNIITLEKRGGRAKLAICEENRTCIRVLNKTGSQGYWAIIEGY